MTKNVDVVIVKGNSPVEMVAEALTLVKAEQAFKNEERILIKPNYINASHPTTGITTDARVIEGIIKYLKEKGFKHIVVGEGSGFADTMKAFEVAGVDKIARKWHVDLLDLNKDEYIFANEADYPALKSVGISKTAFHSAIISVPKLKLHKITGVTLSLKNMMGVVRPKGKMHIHLNEKIAELTLAVKPRLAVIDGIIGGEGHETAGKPVVMNIVIAGLDPVAVDTVGATVMGVNVNNIKHIKLAAEKGVGNCNLDQIRIVGERLENVKRQFKPSLVSHFISMLA